MKINRKILTLGLMLAGVSISSFASAQYYNYNQNYDNNYNYSNNYQQPYGVTSFGGGNSYDPYYSNNNYNNGNYYNNGYYNNNSFSNVSVSSVNSGCYNYSGNYTCNVDPYYSNNNNNNYNSNYFSQTLTPLTYAATYVYQNSATINGNISVTNSNNYYSNNYGTAWFQYGTSYSNLNSSSNPANIYGSTNINANLTNLSCGATYYFRAVSSGPNGLQYGNTMSFTTSQCYNNYYSNNYGNNNYNNNSYYSMPRNIKTNCTHGYSAKKKRVIYY